MEKKTALLLGATGLVGGHLLRGLVDAEGFGRVTVLTRRSVGELARHPKVSEHLVDFECPETYCDLASADVVFCALGTTLSAAGSREAFRKVDYTFCREAAAAAMDAGAQHYLLVSSMGANARSMFFYNRVKGQLEEAMEKMGFASLSIFRPSFLAGDRAKKRRAEAVGLALASAFSFAIPVRYRTVEAEWVARAMIRAAENPEPGLRIFPSEVIRQAGAEES
ncbi:MAG: NAD(P)H-binding protein [Proteobacteria bacterium]|nr:NAD(P)H-binding protein [Pseudomonadota bacterium]